MKIYLKKMFLPHLIKCKCAHCVKDQHLVYIEGVANSFYFRAVEGVFVCSSQKPQGSHRPSLEGIPASHTSECPFCHVGTRHEALFTYPHPILTPHLPTAPNYTRLPVNDPLICKDLVNLYDSHRTAPASREKNNQKEREEWERACVFFVFLSPTPWLQLFTRELWNNLRLMGFLHIIISN